MKKLFMFLVISMTNLIAFAEQEKPIVMLTETNTEVKHVGKNVWFVKHYIKDSSSCGDVAKANCSLMRSEVLEYESFVLNKIFTTDNALLTAYMNHRAGKDIPLYQHDYLKSNLGNFYFTRFVDYSDKKIAFDMDKREIYSVSKINTESEFSIFTLLFIIIVFGQGVRLGISYNKDWQFLRDIVLGVIIIMGVINFVITLNEPYSKSIGLEGFFTIILMLSIVSSFISSAKGKTGSDLFAFIISCSYLFCIYHFSFGDKLIPIVLVAVFVLSFMLFSFLEGSRQWVIKTKDQFGFWFNKLSKAKLT
jgi:hypothetical protein